MLKNCTNNDFNWPYNASIGKNDITNHSLLIADKQLVSLPCIVKLNPREPIFETRFPQLFSK